MFTKTFPFYHGTPLPRKVLAKLCRLIGVLLKGPPTPPSYYLLTEIILLYANMRDITQDEKTPEGLSLGVGATRNITYRLSKTLIPTQGITA